jgi:hypothetical protein
MLLNRATLPEDVKLRSGYFYIPRLGQLNAAQQLPVLMSRFVAQYRALFDDEIRIPKRAEVSEFGDLADHLHILVLEASREAWRYQRFAPFSAARIGVDLTGARINDQRFVPYSRRLDEKLARLLRKKAPFYVGKHRRDRRRMRRAPLVHTDERCRTTHDALHLDVGLEHGRKEVRARVC